MKWPTFTTVVTITLLAACATPPPPAPPPLPSLPADLPEACTRGFVLPPVPPRLRTIETVAAYANRAIDVARDNSVGLALCARHYRVLRQWAEAVLAHQPSFEPDVDPEYALHN